MPPEPQRIRLRDGSLVPGRPKRPWPVRAELRDIEVPEGGFPVRATTDRHRGRALRARRRALGLTLEEVGFRTRRTVGEVDASEQGVSIRIVRRDRGHDSDRFVIASALARFEAEAVADPEAWAASHPTADPTLIREYPEPRLGEV